LSIIGLVGEYWVRWELGCCQERVK